MELSVEPNKRKKFPKTLKKEKNAYEKDALLFPCRHYSLYGVC